MVLKSKGLNKRAVRGRKGDCSGPARGQSQQETGHALKVRIENALRNRIRHARPCSNGIREDGKGIDHGILKDGMLPGDFGLPGI